MRRWVGRTLTTKLGVFGIEGEWESKLHDRSSVQLLLDFFANGDASIHLQPIYRRVATTQSFEFYVRQWRLKRYSKYVVGYFAFHGQRGQLCLGKELIGLDKLGDMLRGVCAWKAHHPFELQHVESV